MTRGWRKGGTPDPAPAEHLTDPERRALIGFLAVTDITYMAVAKVLIGSAADPADVPAISDAIGWADWAVKRRGELPASTYYALVGPFAAVYEFAHTGDVNPDGSTNTTDLHTPDAWRRFPHRSAT